MREILSEDWAWMKQHPARVAAIAVSIAAVVYFIWLGAATTLATYNGMMNSPWAYLGTPSELVETGRPGDGVDERREAYYRYDASQEGVQLPPAKDEPTVTEDGPPEEKRSDGEAQGDGQTCQDRPVDVEHSDLCAQWSSVAASRFGNRIAAENYKISSFAAIVSALGLVLTAIAVIVAVRATRDASRAVSLMKEGMSPFLTVRPTGRPGKGKLKLVNAGTGVATDIAVTIGTEPLRLRRRVLQAGEEFPVTSEVILPTERLIVVLRYKDGSGESVNRTEEFGVVDGAWVQVA